MTQPPNHPDEPRHHGDATSPGWAAPGGTYPGAPGGTPPPYAGAYPTWYAPPPPPKEPPPPASLNGWGIAAIVVAAVGLGVCWLPFVGFVGVPLGVVAIGLGIAGLVLEAYRNVRATAVVGTMLGGLALVLSFVLPVLTGAGFIINTVFELRDEWATIAPTPTESEYGAPSPGETSDWGDTPSTAPEPDPAESPVATPSPDALPTPTATPGG